MDLTSNEAFGAFIKNMDVEAYDSEFAMFRWNAKTDSQILAEKIGGVGQITGLTVTERGPGGAAKALKLSLIHILRSCKKNTEQSSQNI